QINQTFEYSVILDGDLTTAEEFRNIIVKTDANGNAVYLKDVSRVELGQFAYNISAKVNGDPAAMMGIMQTPGGNAVKTADGIYTALDELELSFPDDMEYVIGYETVSIVKESISSVIVTLIEAIILV